MATKKQQQPRPSYERAIGILADLPDDRRYDDQAVAVVAALFNKLDIVVMSAVIGERSIREMQRPDTNVKYRRIGSCATIVIVPPECHTAPLSFLRVNYPAWLKYLKNCSL